MIWLLLKASGIAVALVAAILALIAAILVILSVTDKNLAEADRLVLGAFLILGGLVSWGRVTLLLLALRRHPANVGLQERAQEGLIAALGGSCVGFIGLNYWLGSPVKGPPLTAILLLGFFLLIAPGILFLYRYFVPLGTRGSGGVG